MPMYKNILVAVDITHAGDEFITRRAVEFAKELNATIFMIHVIEGIHAFGQARDYKITLDVEKKALDEAREALDNLGGKYDIFPEQLILDKGSPKTLIVEQAKKHNIDLIIVGTHSRRGINLLLGSTADGVMHRAHCDVLAIRMED